jgi:hypothetical protein
MDEGALDEAAEQLAVAAHLTPKAPGSVVQAFTLFEAQSGYHRSATAAVPAPARPRHASSSTPTPTRV